MRSSRWRLGIGANTAVFSILNSLLALLSGFVGALALLLAGLGLYGGTSYAVSRRRTD